MRHDPGACLNMCVKHECLKLLLLLRCSAACLALPPPQLVLGISLCIHLRPL